MLTGLSWAVLGSSVPTPLPSPSSDSDIVTDAMKELQASSLLAWPGFIFILETRYNGHFTLWVEGPKIAICYILRLTYLQWKCGAISDRGYCLKNTSCLVLFVLNCGLEHAEPDFLLKILRWCSSPSHWGEFHATLRVRGWLWIRVSSPDWQSGVDLSYALV